MASAGRSDISWESAKVRKSADQKALMRGRKMAPEFAWALESAALSEWGMESAAPCAWVRESASLWEGESASVSAGVSEY